MDGNAKTESERLFRFEFNAKPQGRQDAKTILAMSTFVVLVLLNVSMR